MQPLFTCLLFDLANSISVSSSCTPRSFVALTSSNYEPVCDVFPNDSSNWYRVGACLKHFRNYCIHAECFKVGDAVWAMRTFAWAVLRILPTLITRSFYSFLPYDVQKWRCIPGSPSAYSSGGSKVTTRNNCICMEESLGTRLMQTHKTIHFIVRSG